MSFNNIIGNYIYSNNYYTYLALSIIYHRFITITSQDAYVKDFMDTICYINRRKNRLIMIFL